MRGWQVPISAYDFDDDYDIEAWPYCPTCDTAYVLRRSILPAGWIWQRDCKHKGQPNIRTRDDEQ